MSGRSGTAQDRQGDQIFEEHRVRLVVGWLGNLMAGVKTPHGALLFLFTHAGENFAPPLFVLRTN